MCKKLSATYLVERLRGELATGNDDPVREMGTLYVYQVAQDLYELDEELTSVPYPTVVALAVVAYQTGRMLRCQLVLPKPRRKNSHTPKPTIVVSEPVNYGQLRMAL